MRETQHCIGPLFDQTIGRARNAVRIGTRANEKNRPAPPPEVAQVLKRLRVDPRCYLKHDPDAIYTSQGTIAQWRTKPRFVRPDCGPHPGSNSTGHRLPASGDWR
jgi:hypothetical protein